MGKKGKGKQKQDEKPASTTGDATAFQLTPVTEGANVPFMGIEDKSPPNKPSSIQQEPVQQESQATGWGSATGGGGWGSAAGGGWGSNTEPVIGADNWDAGTQEHDGWHHTESLLDPPPVHSHSILPTIHEQSSSGHFETRTESIGESEGLYSEEDYGQETHRGLHSPQSRTGTATAAPSAMGSPRPTPSVSLAQATAEAAKMSYQHVSLASQAARKLEESRRNDNSTHVSSAMATPAGHTASLAPAAPDRTKISTASAYAALHEKKTAPSAAKSPSTQPSASAPKNTWHYRPVHPGNENVRIISPDPSWIMTGGNEWSNKHRTSKSAPSVPSAAMIDQEAWNRHLNHYRQAQQMQQALHEKKVRHAFPPQPQQQHTKHHSHPGHPMQHSHPHHHQHQVQQQQQQQQHQYQQQQQRPAAQKNATWQRWGKNEWEEEEEEEDDDYTESGTDTADAWGTAAQHADAWGQTGGWEQQTKFRDEKRGRGQVPGKKSEAQWGQAEGWGQATGMGEGWDKAAGAGDKRGQATGAGNGWGQPAGAGDGWSQPAGAGGGWGQPAGAGGGWGQPAGAGGGWDREAGDGNEWRDEQGRQHQHQQHQQKHAQRGQHGQGNGWGQDASAWGKNDDTGWGVSGGDDWGTGAGDWGTDGANHSKSEWHTQQHQSKVTVNVADASGSRNAVSAQQRSQILNSLLNNAQGQKHPAGNAAQLHAAALAAAAQKGQQKPKVQRDQWGEAWEAEDDGWGSLGDDEYDGSRRVHFSPKASDIWGGSPRSVPSKTMVQAQQGIATTPINDASNVRFVESRGAAFAFVSSAFFGNGRLARERIHWMFPANKDKRVAAMHAWVQKMSFNIGTYGLLKFLQTRERGALFLNTIFRMHQFPQDPAFDWLTFNQLQGTMDKTLQESVAFYDPARLVIVFVYLPSQTGNSVAIWRIKVNVPDNARLKYQQEVSAITKTLRKDQEYIVMVDELPPKPKVPQKGGLLRKSSLNKSKPNAKNLPYTPNVKPVNKEKRKWWKIFS